MAREIELALQASEIRAVASAKPTPGAELVLQACAATGRQAAIVSNNTASAITAYLDQHGLSPLISGVFGRDPDDVSLMKPDTHLLELALRRLRAERSTTAFVGDTVTDMQAGQAALVWTVGFANKPGKWAALGQAGADSLTTDMLELAEAL
jgi:phosphoglycolate phosphatase